MPIGRYKVIRGVNAPIGGGGLPPLDIDTVDPTLLSIIDTQGKYQLVYDVRPKELAPSSSLTLTGKERVSGKAILQSRTAGAKIDTDPAFNGHPVIDFGVGSGASANQATDLRLDGPPPASFTGFMVVSIAASLKATPAAARLLSFRKDATEIAYLTMIGDGRILWGNTIAGMPAIPLASQPAAGVPFVIAYSYNRTTNKVRLFMNGALIGEATLTTPIEIDATVKVGLGGGAGQSPSNPWLGRMSRPFTVFEGERTDAQVAAITSALKVKYGIA